MLDAKNQSSKMPPLAGSQPGTRRRTVAQHRNPGPDTRRDTMNQRQSTQPVNGSKKAKRNAVRMSPSSEMVVFRDIIDRGNAAEVKWVPDFGSQDCSVLNGTGAMTSTSRHRSCDNNGETSTDVAAVWSRVSSGANINRLLQN